MKKREKMFVMMLLTGLFISMLLAQAPASTYKVIVHKDNPETALSKSMISKYFYKTATKWTNGNHVIPVDKTRDDPVRKAFSEDIIQKRARVVEAYWRQMIFSGRGIPPAQIEDDAGVIEYVSQNPDAIGYITADYDISGQNVKILTVTDE